MTFQVLVVGGNFAGLTTALELKRKGGDEVNVTIVSLSDKFLFIPSLIWVPFRRRDVSDIEVELRPILRKHNIDFVQTKATSIDPDNKELVTEAGVLGFDHLVVATGPKVDFDVAPGVRDFAHYVGTPEQAIAMRESLDKLVANPGPVVIGASQRAGCMGAAYEFLFNFEQWLREQGIRKQVELTWITPEDFLGHFGIEGIKGGQTMLKSFMKMFNIHFRTQVAIERMEADRIYLSNGECLPFAFSMIIPPFLGVDLIRSSENIRHTEPGYLPVNEHYQHEDWPFIWGAGIAIDVPPPFKPKAVPFNVPKTGYPADETGKIVAKNILRSERHDRPLVSKPWGKIAALCVMDAGKKEVIILGSSMFKPRWFAVMIPNVIFDFGKVAFEKYFLWKTRHGYSFLP